MSLGGLSYGDIVEEESQSLLLQTPWENPSCMMKTSLLAVYLPLKVKGH